MRAEKPETATAIQASGGDGGDVSRRTRGTRGAFCGSLWRPLALRSSDGFADSAGLEPCATSRRLSHMAPPAAITLSPTPTHVVALSPSAGISQKPAAIAPAAAPT